MVVAEVMFDHEVSQAQPVQAREAEEVPCFQLGGIQRRAAPSGRFDVWFDEEAIANWKADKSGKPGGQRVYSDMAIETGLVVRMVYKLAYRQTEGFLHSIASLLQLCIEIPDYSTGFANGRVNVGRSMSVTRSSLSSTLDCGARRVRSG